jgi:NADPH-dependent 2,4-dienoyl-CoA reductase/sulfur reductase-like enzyme
MSADVARRASVWIDTGPDQPALARLSAYVDTDVVVIGGGIVGITAALLLKQAGVGVVLLEANQLAWASPATRPPRSPPSTG